MADDLAPICGASRNDSISGKNAKEGMIWEQKRYRAEEIVLKLREADFILPHCFLSKPNFFFINKNLTYRSVSFVVYGDLSFYSLVGYFPLYIFPFPLRHKIAFNAIDYIDSIL